MKKNKKVQIFKITVYSYFLFMSIFIISKTEMTLTLIEKILYSLGLCTAFVLIIELIFIQHKILLKKQEKCKHCGAVIKSIDKSCTKKTGKYLGSENRVTYEDVVSKTTSRTEHLRGGYTPRNYAGPNRYSETTETTTTKMPINRTVYGYEITYLCKNCGKTHAIRNEYFNEKLK